MKKVLIILLFIIFSANSSLANNSEKITVEEIENIFFENKRKYPIINVIKENSLNDSLRIIKKEKRENKKWYESIKKRVHINKGIVKCMHHNEVKTLAKGWHEEPVAYENCRAKVVRAVLSRSERAQKKWPGDIFFALAAIHNLLDVREAELHRNFTKHIKYKLRNPRNETLG